MRNATTGIILNTERDDDCAAFYRDLFSLEDALQTIRNHGIAAEISVNDWGSSIDVFEPDGNRVGIREEGSFAARIGH